MVNGALLSDFMKGVSDFMDGITHEIPDNDRLTYYLEQIGALQCDLDRGALMSSIELGIPPFGRPLEGEDLIRGYLWSEEGWRSKARFQEIMPGVSQHAEFVEAPTQVWFICWPRDKFMSFLKSDGHSTKIGMFRSW